MANKNWIASALPKSSKGKLHKALKVPLDKKIPLAKLEKAENSKSPKIRKQAQLAETLRKMRKK
jgi:hypothetical protein